MRSEPLDRHVRTVQLTPFQTDRLTTLLDQLLQRGARRTDLESLEALREKLADARFLARWLHDSVRVDFSHEEVVDVVQMLANSSDELTEADQKIFANLLGQVGQLGAKSAPLLAPIAQVITTPLAAEC